MRICLFQHRMLTAGVTIVRPFAEGDLGWELNLQRLGVTESAGSSGRISRRGQRIARWAFADGQVVRRQMLNRQGAVAAGRKRAFDRMMNEREEPPAKMQISDQKGRKRRLKLSAEHGGATVP
jgi:hypothetical protein